MTNHALYYFEDVAKHNTKGDCWVTISAKVYDVSSFLEDHPGGDEVLLAAAGKDATADFEDVGHSDDALGLMKRYYIGEVDKFTLPVKQKDSYKGTSGGNQSSGSGAGFVKMLQFLLPLLILGFALALRHYKNKE